jgi:RsiW-degrading membrane proteinase PrsW (M82 family)
MWWKQRVIQLFSSTTRLHCCYSRSHFSLLLLHLILSSRTQTYTSIDLNQREKKGIVLFSLSLLLPKRFNYTRKNTNLTFSFNLILVSFFFFLQVYINRLYLMTTLIVLIEFKVKTSDEDKRQGNRNFSVYSLEIDKSD